jgi:uncharacterized repeat protein (TIGR03803 family)
MKRKFDMTAAAAALALLVSPFAGESAHAQVIQYSEKKLYDFCSQSFCFDGKTPIGDIAIGSSGNLYGTTTSGGATYGVVFELVPHKSKYKFSLVWAFGVDDRLASPEGDLILDKDGNLYGSAYLDRDEDCGAVFELKPNGGNWSLSTIYKFSGGSDGCNPYALTYAGKASGQPWDESSPLYGTTQFGGAYDNGAVYQLAYNGSYWTQTTIHSFQTSSVPWGLMEDAVGNLWGTTENGGKYGGGLMYRLASGTWKETVLHNFCNMADCADGAGPIGRLFMDSSGNVFGTTSDGGSNCSGGPPCLGVVFEYTSGGAYQVIYNFCSAANCADGAIPFGGVIMDGSGNLVGTTSSGGSGQYAETGGSGAAFELTNSRGVWSETVLHSFCSLSGCTDGEFPDSDPAADTSGRIFAVSQGGSTSEGGNVFELKPR